VTCTFLVDLQIEGIFFPRPSSASCPFFPVFSIPV
jgi:hypothetical protein